MSKDVDTLDGAALSDGLSSSPATSDVSLDAQHKRRFLSLSNRRGTQSYHGISGCRNRKPQNSRLNNWRQSPLFTEATALWSDESDSAMVAARTQRQDSLEDAEEEQEDVENRKPKSYNSNLLSVPMNTSTPIVTDPVVAVPSDTALFPERVIRVKKLSPDWSQPTQAPVKSVEPTQPPLRTTPSLILPTDDEDDGALWAAELPIDPYKRARKFLYRLAPLLKLSLPSRVERKRAENVFDFLQVPSGGGTLPVPYSSRTSPWIRQWMKHGVMIHHCITFSGADPSEPGAQPDTGPPTTAAGTPAALAPGPCPLSSGSPHWALINADYYVQDLWHELQLRLHGPLFMEELRKRRAFANTVMQRIVSFSMQPTDPEPITCTAARCARGPVQPDTGIEGLHDTEPESCSLSSDYLTLLTAASKSVSQLLQQTDRVEQAWSSDARLVSEFSDWALPEVRCRLVCLRQWSGTLASLQRGVHQLCEFLHCPTSTQCTTHVTSIRHTTEIPISEGDVAAHELSSCPILLNGAKRDEQPPPLYREFLKGSWLMPPLPRDLLQSTKSAVNSNAMHPNRQSSGPLTDLNELTVHPHWGGLSMALIRLDRLVGRLLFQVTDNLNTTSARIPEKNASTTVSSRPVYRPTMPENAPTPVQTNRHLVSVCPNLTPTHSSLSPQRHQASSSVSSHLPSSNKPGSVPVRPQQHVQRGRSANVFSSTGNNIAAAAVAAVQDTSDTEEPKQARNVQALQTSQIVGLHPMEPRRVASYAEIVKRRSWSEHLSPHSRWNALHRSTDMRSMEERTPVNWEICSPAPSLSPYARTPLSSSSPSASQTPSSDSRSPSHSSQSSSSSALTSDRSLKSSSLSAVASSKSPHMSSSNSSLPSMLRPRCAVAASPTSAESCASLLSIDLCNRSSLTRPPPPAPPATSVPTLSPTKDDATASRSSSSPRAKFPAINVPGSELRPAVSTNLHYRPKDLGTELGLPTLVPLWLFLAQVPFDVVLEAVTMKLEQYDERILGTTQPNKVSLDHLVNELRELLSTALQITVTYRKRLVAALKLDTMAQLRIPFSAHTMGGTRSTRSVLGCTHSDSDSDNGLGTVDAESRDVAARNGTPPGRWPQWFRRATHKVRAFLDSNYPASTVAASANASGSGSWPVSLPMLLDVYVDCFARLIDGQCWVGEGDPSILRSRIENEWNFLRRLFRQLYRCRGGLQYFSMRNASLAVQILPPTAEAAFIRACQRFLGLISKQLCPFIGDWLSSALTTRTHRASVRSDTGPFDGVSAVPLEHRCKNGCSLADPEPDSLHDNHGWTSPHSSIGATGRGSGCLRTEVFQEFNETWRELRAWLNCLLDLTGVMCGDLDTSVVLNFYVPHRSSSKAGSVLSTRLAHERLTGTGSEPDCAQRSGPTGSHGGGLPGQLSLDSEPGDTRSRAYARLARELRRTGHVLLHAWAQPKPDALSPDMETNPNMGCIFIWSPLLQPNFFPDYTQQGNNPYKLSADSTSGDRFDRYNSSHEERGLIIVSPEQRRAVRFHISELVHRILRQLIFKFRKHCTSSTPGVLPSVSPRSKPGRRRHARYRDRNASNVQSSKTAQSRSAQGNRIRDNYRNESNGQTSNKIQANASPATQAGAAAVGTGNNVLNGRAHLLPVSKSHTEYLLICPEFPERVWDGLVYRFSGHSAGPAQSRSAYSRRLHYALSWLALMSTRGSLAPLFTASVELSNLITCHLLAEKPYSAWTMLCEGSTRLRRWLSLGLTHMKSTGFDGLNDSSSVSAQQHHIDGQPAMDVSSPTNACILHLAPIHPDLGAACAQLHKSLCDLSARLHASLLVMDSHLRGWCEQHADDCERVVSRHSSSATLDQPRPYELRRLRSVSPRRSTSKELTTHTLSGDALQRAYSVAFGFHKTLMRLMATAPLTNTLQNDDALVSASDTVTPNLPIQTALANLGVQLLASWSRFVTGRYQRGRGRIPRWANDACHFAYQLCQPRSVTFLDARKVASLEATLNDLIPHLVGEEKSTDGNSLSPVLSRLSPICVHESIDKPLFARCNSTASSTQVVHGSNSLRRRHRRVHSLHSDSQCKRNLSVTARPSWRQTNAAAGKQGGSFDGELMSQSGLTYDDSTAVVDMLYQLDAIRDERLRQVGLIGRPRPLNGGEHSPIAAAESDAETNAGPGTDASVLSRPSTPRLTRRKFPYTWNRGRLIGRGITGEVFQAFNLQTQEMMAVKEIRFDYDTFADADAACSAAEPSGSDSPRQRTTLLRQRREAQTRLHAFRRECDLLSSLSHPALVRFLGADEQTPKVFRLFTELCTAGTLADVVRDRLPEALVRRYAQDLARAVAYLHDRGIVHRDIKPANIFLVGSVNTPAGLSANMSNTSLSGSGNRPGRGTVIGGQTQDYALLKLGDFSHALRLHSLSNSSREGEIREVAGTVCYMAPEVCQSQSRGLDTGYGRPCDIWSYCCVLLELITGRQPWHGYRDSLAIFYRLCRNQTPTLPPVYPNTTTHSSEGGSAQRDPSATVDGLPYASAEAVALLRAGIQPDPTRRPTAAELFQFDFVHCPVSYLSHIELAHSR